MKKQRIIGILICMLMIVTVVPIASSEDTTSSSDIDWWPMYGHDPQNSCYSLENGPDSCEVKWSVLTGRPSYPTIVDYRIYIGGGKDVKC